MLSLIGSLCAVCDLYAQEQYDDLQISITSNKEEYKRGEVAETTIVVTNQSQQTVSNVEVECLLPEGLKLVDGHNGTTSIEELEAGKTLTMTVHVKMESTAQMLPTPQTGDMSNFWSVSLTIIAAIAIGFILFWLKKERIASQKLFSILVWALIVTGMGILSHKVIAQASVGEIVNIQEIKEIIIEDDKYDIVFQIGYEKMKDATVGDGEPGNNDSSALELVDFVVEVEGEREPVILQLSDTQIIDPTQDRRPTPLSQGEKTYWAPEKIDERLYDSLTETIEATNPDLILITGDLVYGEFDDNGTMFESLIMKMESFGIPWAPVFGNHENESAKGVDWQCQQLENAEHCLFKQRTLTGNGNYTVGIKQNGSLKRVFFMMDSNGCGGMHANSLANGHSKTTAGFGKDQMDWSIGVAEQIKEISPDTKISYAFHIQIYAFKDAYAKYGFTNSGTKENPINIDKLDSKADGDFGYIGRDLKGPWDKDYAFYNRMKAVGVDSIFVAHEHCNSASVVYEGIRFQFGQKLGTYDRANFVKNDGTIYGAYCGEDTPLSGGTVMKMSEKDGSFVDAYIYLSGDAQAKLDGTYKEPEKVPEEEPTIVVNGLQTGTDLVGDNVVNITAATIGGENAWKCDAGRGQGKVYVSTELLQDKRTFTFSVYVPTESTTAMLLPDRPLFAIRVKPNDSEPILDNNINGYIEYGTTVDDAKRKLLYGQWQTFTVDVTGLSETCTEFAFNIGSGNVIYLKDVTFSEDFIGGEDPGEGYGPFF